MRSDDVLVIGEALIDVVTDGRGVTAEHVGGSAANVAVALARLGRPVRLATSYGDDARGRLIGEHLTASGVALAGEPRILPRTSTASATIGADGSASYGFDLEWRLGAVEIGAPRIVHVGSIGAVLAPGRDEVLRLLRAAPDTALVCYDVNARPMITGAGHDLADRVEQIATLAQLVKASDEDLEVVYPGIGPVAAARRLGALGARAVVVTRGGGGALWVTPTEVLEVAARPVAVVDTIGAGDTFSAALLDALWEDPGKDPHEALEHAVRAAAVTVSRAGANPPYRAELSAR